MEDGGASEPLRLKCTNILPVGRGEVKTSWSPPREGQRVRVTDTALEEAARGPRPVPADEPLLAVARSVGTSFGETDGP
jgi:hypothetical protein